MSEFTVAYRFVFIELLGDEYALQVWRGVGNKCSPDCGSVKSGGGTHEERCQRRPALIETRQHPVAAVTAPFGPMFWYCWELHARYGVPEELTREKWEEFMVARSAAK